MTFSLIRRRNPAGRRASGRSRVGRTCLVLGALALLVGLVAAVGHYRTMHAAKLIGVAAFSPYLMLAAPVAVLLFLLARSRVWVVVALAMTAWFVAVQAPLFVAADAPSGGTDLRVMTSNLRLGLADAADVVAAVRRDDAAVLMLEELTPDEQQRLEAAGLTKLLPFHVSDPRAGAAGTGLWSRYPLSDEVRRTDFTFGFVTATVTLPGTDHRLFLAATHLAGPWPKAVDWGRDIAHLPAVLRSFPTDVPVLVGGDFNATPDLTQFRRLLVGGYADAADQAGAGVTATYPSDRWFPPLIAIDHVLTRGGAVARTADTIEIPGSDHRALAVKVRID